MPMRAQLNMAFPPLHISPLLSDDDDLFDLTRSLCFRHRDDLRGGPDSVLVSHAGRRGRHAATAAGN